ncbi:MAG TPA: protease complex subunit PrcB family protein [Flavobacterium sp.]|jgi:hypothetical protein
MKKVITAFVILFLVSCASKQPVTGNKALFEVMTVQNDGGANIRFYEILTEQKEIAMLQGDENLRNKISPSDMTNSNFIILNMGEKPSAGYSLLVEDVTETTDKIIVTVRDKEPEGMAATVISYPYTILKINSKKPIEIK